MVQHTQLQKRLRGIYDTYILTYQTLRWIWDEILSPYSRGKATLAVALILIAMFTAIGSTHLFKGAVNALAAGNRNEAALFILGGVGVLLTVYQILRSLHDHVRELSWNDNYKNLYVGFSRLLFGRTMHELITEENEVGAEQIESTKDKVHNILYLVLFESTQVLASIVAVIVLTAVVDVRVSMILLALVVFNVGWFLFFNATLEDRVREIEHAFRLHNNRSVDQWNAYASVKSAGVENKIVKQIHNEVLPTLEKDKEIWAHWFVKRDFVRSSINNVLVVGVLAIGVLFWEWSVGDFAALFTWNMLLLDRFGFIGHIMRQLTDQVARIRAVREALTKPPLFSFDAGLTYTRGTSCTSD